MKLCSCEPLPLWGNGRGIRELSQDEWVTSKREESEPGQADHSGERSGEDSENRLRAPLAPRLFRNLEGGVVSRLGSVRCRGLRLERWTVKWVRPPLFVQSGVPAEVFETACTPLPVLIGNSRQISEVSARELPVPR